MEIPFVLSEIYLQAGIKKYIMWNPESSPHLAISGITGSGKTACAKLLCAKVSKYVTDSHLTVCDYKGDKDFSFLDGCKRFHRFDACMEGLNVFYNTFLEVQQTGQAKGFQLLLFDEWQSFINSVDKKQSDEAKKKLSILLSLGRSFNFHVALSQQRLNAEDFGKSRDQFSVVLLLGNASKEVIGMLFNDYKEYFSNDRKRATGHILIDGCNFQKVIVPQIGSMGLVNRAIKEAVTR